MFSMNKVKLGIAVALLLGLTSQSAYALSYRIEGTNSDEVMVYGWIYKCYRWYDEDHQIWAQTCSGVNPGLCTFERDDGEADYRGHATGHDTWTATNGNGQYVITGDANSSGSSDDVIYPADKWPDWTDTVLCDTVWDPVLYKTFYYYVTTDDDAVEYWKDWPQNAEMKIFGDWNAYDSTTGGDDNLYGWDNADLIYGVAGDDSIDGSAGDDFLYGNKGDNDYLYGGDGDDTLHGNIGTNDGCIGGAGSDTLGGTCEWGY